MEGKYFSSCMEQEQEEEHKQGEKQEEKQEEKEQKQHQEEQNEQQHQEEQQQYHQEGEQQHQQEQAIVKGRHYLQEEYLEEWVRGCAAAAELKIFFYQVQDSAQLQTFCLL